MIVLKFGKWSTSGEKKYVYRRMYFMGYKWTPFCRKRMRNYHRALVEFIIQKENLTIENTREEMERLCYGEGN